VTRIESKPARVAAFFDVDNTIIRGASAFHIARGLRQRGFLTYRDIVRFGWEQLKYLMFGEDKTQIDELRNEGLRFIKGWSVAEMAAIGEEVYDEVLALRIFPGTRAILDDHLAKGHEVWLITASPVEVGKIIAGRLGATGALGTIAEHHRGYYTGNLVGDMMHGAAKLVGAQGLAKERGIDLAKSYAYGDSMNDAQILGGVGHPTAINPDRRLRCHAKAEGWAIKEFRSPRIGGRWSIVRASAMGTMWVITALARALWRATIALVGRH